MNVLASCDSIYFLEHYKAFYSSCVSVGYIPHIVIINPTEEVKSISKNLKNISYMTYDSPSKTLYAINRFIIAEEFIGDEGVLITDIDCFFNKKLPEIKEDIGLFLREYENFEGMKVAAGIVWFGPTISGKKFAKLLKEKIMKKPWKWYVDQISLYETYKEVKQNTSVFTFNSKYMDWEFTEDSYMWTGKGPRKYKNLTYLNRKRELEN